MELLNMPVTLVIKAPNQKIEDYTVECALNWTVRKLKEHLATVYPNKPREHQQRIIYSGRLLQDHVTLKEVLRQYEPNQTIHTVHLVCSQTNEPTNAPTPPATNTNSASWNDTGLRLRHSVTSSSSQSASPTQSTDTSFTQFSTSTTTSPPLAAPSSFSPHPQMPPYNHFGAYYQPPIVPQYNPYVHAHPGVAVGMMPGGMMPDPMTMGAYSVDQMMLMQQAYAQYLAQYMQFYQQNGGQQPPPPAMEADLSNALPPQVNRNAPAAAAENGARAPVVQAMRMNAQGGAMVDDDEDDPNRDWLDWVYTSIRILMLMCILYFYSSLSRFIATIMFVVIIYLYQSGWFKLNRRPREGEQPANPQPPQPVQQQQQHQQQPPPANNEDADDGNDGDIFERSPAAATVTGDGAAAAAEAAVAARRGPSALTVAWNFFVAFFASLAPQQPPV